MRILVDTNILLFPIQNENPLRSVARRALKTCTGRTPATAVTSDEEASRR
jgi:hypothetical protein